VPSGRAYRCRTTGLREGSPSGRRVARELAKEIARSGVARRDAEQRAKYLPRPLVLLRERVGYRELLQRRRVARGRQPALLERRQSACGLQRYDDALLAGRELCRPFEIAESRGVVALTKRQQPDELHALRCLLPRSCRARVAQCVGIAAPSNLDASCVEQRLRGVAILLRHDECDMDRGVGFVRFLVACTEPIHRLGPRDSAKHERLRELLLERSGMQGVDGGNTVSSLRQKWPTRRQSIGVQHSRDGIDSGDGQPAACGGERRVHTTARLRHRTRRAERIVKRAGDDEVAVDVRVQVLEHE
jgi:hypothetical protein